MCKPAFIGVYSTCSCKEEDKPTSNINTQKDNALHHIFPKFSQTPQCTMMLLGNIAEPDWINVNCSDHILSHVFCSLPNTNDTEQAIHHGIHENTTCALAQFVSNNTCFHFVWFQSEDVGPVSEVCSKLGKKIVPGFKLDDWKFLLDAIQSTFPAVIVGPNVSHIQEVSFKKYSFVIKSTNKAIKPYRAEGYIVCSEKVEYNQAASLSVLFSCEKGGYISQYYQCDDIIDCFSDFSDEAQCTCHDPYVESNICKQIIQDDKSLSCGDLFLQSRHGTCEKYFLSPETNLGEEHKVTSAFSCKNRSLEPWSLVNDLIPDSEMAEDEHELLALLVNNTVKSCAKASQLPCREGHSKCFSVEDICIFEQDNNNNLYPCRNGAHVQMCMDILCNKKFKCRDSFCLPWKFVCNGQWNCPDGDDEKVRPFCGKLQCTGMFRCKKRELCIPITNICDNILDCPVGDDEIMCDLFSIECPSGCFCLAYAMHCQNSSYNFLFAQFPYQFVALHGGFVKHPHLFNDTFPEVVYILLQNSAVVEICGIFTIDKFVQTVHVDFRFNAVTVLETLCFDTHQKVAIVLLSNNLIISVKFNAFASLLSLVTLDLSQNPLTSVADQFLFNTTNFYMFRILETQIHHFTPNTFRVLDMKLIVTENYKICCVTHPNTKCKAHQPWYMSCSDLLPNIHFRVLFGCLSLLVVVLNISSIILHIVTRTTKETFPLMVISVNATDLFCGVYLLTIWTSDLNMEGMFILKETLWKSSFACYFAFGTVVFYTLNVQFVLIFMSFSRMRIAVKPMTTHVKEYSFVIKFTSVFFSISVLVAAFLTTAASQFVTKLPVSFCLPFIDPEGSVHLMKAIVWFTLTSQAASSITIFILHIILWRAVEKSFKQFKHMRPVDNNIFMFIQLLFITVSNIFCWLPANVIFAIAMFLNKFPMDLIIWTTIVVLPLTAVVNPAVFVCTSIRKFYQGRKKFQK